MIHRWFRPQGDSKVDTIWLTVYADLMTNLVLVFLALYGLTVMGQRAVAEAMESVKGTPEILQGMDLNFETLAPLLRHQFQNTPGIIVTEEAGAVRIEFGENILFESGKAKTKSKAKDALKIVASYLKSMPRTIVVEGHTDSVPLQAGGAYHDNWELSLARAMSVVDLLVNEGGISPDHLAAAAYGSYRPRASNLTKEGRRMNRRVEIALFDDFPYEFPNKKTSEATPS